MGRGGGTRRWGEVVGRGSGTRRWDEEVGRGGGARGEVRLDLVDRN